MVRTDSRHLVAAATVRTIAQKLDPAVHVSEIVTMEDVRARETAPWRFAMQVLTGFGIFAAVVAAVGLTGLVSLVVALRERELGIRAALGSTPARLRRHVATKDCSLSRAGAVLGCSSRSHLAACLRHSSLKRLHTIRFRWGAPRA
jgi:ABC-type antimicrobial peptide transport system permease subunit